MSEEQIKLIKENNIFAGDIYLIKALDHHNAYHQRPEYDKLGKWKFNHDLCVIEAIGRIINVTEYEVHLINFKVFGDETDRADILFIVKSTIIKAIKLVKGEDMTERIKSMKDMNELSGMGGDEK